MPSAIRTNYNNPSPKSKQKSSSEAVYARYGQPYPTDLRKHLEAAQRGNKPPEIDWEQVESVAWLALLFGCYCIVPTLILWWR